jgi:hypothetical protein
LVPAAIYTAAFVPHNGAWDWPENSWDEAPMTACHAALLLLCGVAPAADGPPKLPVKTPAVSRLPVTGLPPARYVPGLCMLHYRVSTASPECQAFFDQGLGYWYSYVWMESARCFETAAQCDPDCALAWWGLSRALERWDRGDPGKSERQTLDALRRADTLRLRAGHREQLLIQARMQEKGLAPGSADKEANRRAAVATIDTLLALYEDDEEGWFYRAQLAGGEGLFGGTLASAPFYKALVRINPLHPGANHELLHFYEGFRRPALGWVHAERYIESSPGIPHPFHMQAHLATRLGRWDRTSDRSTRAVELERAYHKQTGVKPVEDHQFGHHLEILLVSLTHDGRFAEARAVEKEARAAGLKQHVAWFRLHLAERAWDEARAVADDLRRSDKVTAGYLSALLHLRRGEVERALPEIEVLQQGCADSREDRERESRLWEVEGLYLCRTSEVGLGLKLLARVSERSKEDYRHHAWGNGASYLEAWGTEALRAGRDQEAEEAFLEALAHDPAAVRSALGLQVLCEHQGRAEEATRYAALARRCWSRADAGRLDAELAALRAERGGSRRVTAVP